MTSRKNVNTLPDDLHLHARFSIELTRAVERANKPSELINSWQAALILNQYLLEQSSLLFNEAPTLYKVIYFEVSRAFGCDCDQVLWTSSYVPYQPVTLTLTQIAAENLREDFRDADLSRDVTLGGEALPDQTLMKIPEQVLDQLHGLDLKGRYNLAVGDYWQNIARGQSVSRADFAGELRCGLIQTRALMAQACGQISEAGLMMWQQVIDAPDEQARRNAGGGAELLQVSEVSLVNGNGREMVLKGALVIHARDGEQNPLEMLFVPGLDNELFEFDSRAELLAQMQSWFDSESRSAWLLWQLLPYHSRSLMDNRQSARPVLTFSYRAIAGDCFQLSARASIFTQHSNELISAVMIRPGLLTGDAGDILATDASGVAMSYAQSTEQWRHAVAGTSLPAELIDVVAELIRCDARWHEDDISFGSLASTLALRNRQEKIVLEEHGIVQLLNEADLTLTTPRFNALVSHRAALQAQREAALNCLKGLLAPSSIDNAQWLTTDSGQGSPQQHLISSRSLALVLEGELQVLQHRLEPADFALLSQALKHNLTGYDRGSNLRVMAVAMGTAQQAFPLVGTFIITSRQALLTPLREEPTLLYVPGHNGGLARFKSLMQLQAKTGNTLSRNPDCALWMTVALQEQAPARAWVDTLPGASPVELQLSEIKVGVIEHSVKSQIKAHKGSLLAINKNVLVIEGADRNSALSFLAQSTSTLLQVPENAAREQAFANIEMQRQARLLKQKQVPWLSAKDEAVQVDYAHRFSDISESYLAVEHYLSTNLPSIVDFAVAKLREQFVHDGFNGELDPLADMILIPDAVNIVKTLRSPLNLPGEFVPEIELAQIPQGMRTYNMVQLALENFDLEDPQIALRFKHMQVLQPRWRSRLTLAYLQRTIGVLDVSGAYERKINRVFRGQDISGVSNPASMPGNQVLHQLMVRPHRQTLELELWKAREQGLDVAALTLFSHAINARKADDLERTGLHIKLGRLTYGSDVERYGLTSVAGARVIHEVRSDLTLVYMPDSPGGKTLVSYPSLQSATTALAALGAVPAALAWFSQRTAAEEELVEVQHHLEAAYSHGPHDWLAAQFIGDVDLAWSLALERPDRLINRLRLTTQSTARRDVVRSEREHQERIATMFKWMGLVPGLNLAADIYYIIQAFKALQTASSTFEAFQDVLQIGMCLVDIIITVASFGGDRFQLGSGERILPAEHVQARLALQSLKVRQAIGRGGWEARGIKPAPRPFMSPDFTGYEVSLSPQDACRLSGKYDNGSYLKDGVQFIVQKGKSIQVTRPRNAQALHLQDPVSGRVGLPVRMTASGEWQLATGYGLPGGGKAAEEILNACGMSQEVARGLLADYDFPQDSGLDLLFALSVKKNGIRPEWANRFRASGSGPVAGTSQGATNIAQSSARHSEAAPPAIELQGYEVEPMPRPASSGSQSTFDSVVIGNDIIYIARDIDGDGFYTLYRTDPLAPRQFVECGRLSQAGVYHIQDPLERDYVAIAGRFYEIHHDFHLNRTTVLKPNTRDGVGPIVVPGRVFRRMGEWRLPEAPVSLINHSVKLENLLHQLLPQASEVEIRQRILRYGRQINKATVPELRLARGVAELERMATQHTYREGLPYEQMIQIFEAQNAGLPLPEGMPVYDELQGLAPLEVFEGNYLNVRDGVEIGNFMSILPLANDESLLVTMLRIELKSREKMQLSTSGVMNQLLRSIFSRKGYEILGSGTESLFKRGYCSLVCKGPNGDAYIVTIKLSGKRPTGGKLRSASMSDTRHGVHFSDPWATAVLREQLTEFPDSLLISTMRQAHERGRLFKVLAVFSREGDLYIFRIVLPKDL